jgi:hypothetical protein
VQDGAIGSQLWAREGVATQGLDGGELLQEQLNSMHWSDGLGSSCQQPNTDVYQLTGFPASRVLVWSRPRGGGRKA